VKKRPADGPHDHWMMMRICMALHLSARTLRGRASQEEQPPHRL
jgi:hypothetical protein